LIGQVPLERQQVLGGFPAWTEDDVDRYEARWPLGTKERVWLGVLLYTGLRRGDAVRVGCQHIRDGVVTLRTEKTGIIVTVPLLPALDEILRAGPCGDLAFICGENGCPLTKESFGNFFRDACNAAGVEKSAHGARKIGATRAANNGATVASSKPSSVGRAGAWPRSTRAQPIVCGLQRAQGRSSIEHRVNNLFPYLVERCGRQSRKWSEISGLIFRWWGR